MSRLRVSDVMTRRVVAVREAASYKEIADVLTERGVSAVPVLDAADHVVGVVSEADLLHTLELQGDEAGHRLFERRRRRVARDKAHQDRARGLMTSPAVTILPEASVVEAARLMERYAVKRLPVVNHLGRLVGIVSRRDLVRIFLRTDTAIRDEVIEQVLRRTLGVIPGEVNVRVRGGMVTLSGEVQRTSMIEIALRLTGTVDGVVGVVSQLTAAYDDALERTYQGMTSPLRHGTD